MSGDGRTVGDGGRRWCRRICRRLPPECARPQVELETTLVAPATCPAGLDATTDPRCGPGGPRGRASRTLERGLTREIMA